jgi:hypothetical protein
MVGLRNNKVDLGATGASVKLIYNCRHCTLPLHKVHNREFKRSRKKNANSSATAAKKDLYKILGLHRQKIDDNV